MKCNFECPFMITRENSNSVQSYCRLLMESRWTRCNYEIPNTSKECLVPDKRIVKMKELVEIEGVRIVDF